MPDFKIYRHNPKTEEWVEEGRFSCEEEDFDGVVEQLGLVAPRRSTILDLSSYDNYD